MKAKPTPKRQVNWRLSDNTREIIRTLAALDRRSQSTTLEIILEREAARREIVVKTKGTRMPDHVWQAGHDAE